MLRFFQIENRALDKMPAHTLANFNFVRDDILATCSINYTLIRDSHNGIRETLIRTNGFAKLNKLILSRIRL